MCRLYCAIIFCLDHFNRTNTSPEPRRPSWSGYCERCTSDVNLWREEYSWPSSWCVMALWSVVSCSSSGKRIPSCWTSWWFCNCKCTKISFSDVLRKYVSQYTLFHFILTCIKLFWQTQFLSCRAVNFAPIENIFDAAFRDKPNWE